MSEKGEEQEEEKDNYLAKHPVSAYGAILHERRKPTPEQEEACFNDCKALVDEVAAREFCFLTNSSNNPKKQKPGKCTCMHGLRTDEATKRALARFMVEYAAKKSSDKKDWWTFILRPLYKNNCKDEIRARALLSQKLFLPIARGKTREENEGINVNYLVCRNALASLLGMGRVKMRTITSALKSNTLVPIHGLVGKPANSAKKFQAEVYPSMHAYFSQFKEMAATQPPADAGEAKMMTNDEAKDVVKKEEEEAGAKGVATGMSKRALYYRYCRERGWIIKVDAQGRIDKKPNPEMETKDVPSRKCFLDFWKKHYPDVR